MENIFRRKKKEKEQTPRKTESVLEQVSVKSDLEEAGFVKGEPVELRKISIDEGSDSAVSVGRIISSKLQQNIKVGSSVFLDNGRTSPVSNYFKKDGKHFIQTRTSLYEIVLKKVSNLEIKNDYGEVHVPFDTKIAELKNETIDIHKKVNEEDVSFFIDKEKLQGILLEIQGGQLFRAQGRFIVVAKVGNGHLPFYVSLHGTGGKQGGKWYPFFGSTDKWFVKGTLTNKENGEMYYSDSIKKVQDVLNENLQLPASRYISTEGELRINPRERDADLSKMLKYQDQASDEKSVEFIRRITGYRPEKVYTGTVSVSTWINSIVRSLG